jgi:hypothetical protein
VRVRGGPMPRVSWTGIGEAPGGGPSTNPRKRIADGVGFEPTSDVRHRRLSRPGTPFHDCQCELPRKQYPNAFWPPFSAGQSQSAASAEPRHAPPPRATPRMVARQGADKARLARRGMTQNSADGIGSPSSRPPR